MCDGGMKYQCSVFTVTFLLLFPLGSKVESMIQDLSGLISNFNVGQGVFQILSVFRGKARNKVVH